MSVLQQLAAQIAAQGPITVAEYMRHAVTHYYAKQEPFGAEGDFTTAPEISQVFGELIGAWLADMWQQLGSPTPCVLTELGPGRGTLMKDILRATRHVKGFHAACSLHLVENSERLRALQQHTLIGAHPHLSWHDSIVDLPTQPLLLMANEFFDALPIHQHIRTPTGWAERRIGMHEGKLVWNESVEGEIRETCPEGEAIMASLAQHIHAHGGAMLVIDYGYVEGAGDTLQALRKHQYHPVLEDPGEADLTAHVNFAALAQAASRSAQTYGPVTQAAFLSRLGIELRTEALLKQANDAQKQAIVSSTRRLVAADAMGTLFKVLAVTSSGLTPAGF